VPVKQEGMFCWACKLTNKWLSNDYKGRKPLEGQPRLFEEGPYGEGAD